MERIPRGKRRHFVPALGMALLLGLAGCGVKGTPEPPPDAEPEEIRAPGPQTPPPEGERPEEPFILDGLL